MRGLLKEQLVGAGYDVQLGDPRPAPSAKPANDDIELIIADICMPKEQGAETIRALKQQVHPGASIIVISGRVCTVGGSAEAARRLGVQKVLSKPFTREDLLEAVRAVIHAPAEQRTK